MTEIDEVVEVEVIREDLRQLLLAADLYADEMDETPGKARLKQAIHRIGGLFNSAEWQPKTKFDA